MGMSEKGPKDWKPESPLGVIAIFRNLALVAPSISFEVNRTEDPYFVWDGDGPDPREEGYIPYDYDVYARAIIGGKLFEGRQSLGGSYGSPDDEDGDRDIHGYLPQMIDEALDELSEEVGRKPIRKEIKAAQKYMEGIMEKRYGRESRH